MIPRAEILEHYRAMATRQPPALSIQRRAAEQLQTLDLPSKKDEDWHFTPLTSLLEYAFSPAPCNEGISDRDEILLGDISLNESENIRIVLINGRFNSALSDIPEKIVGLELCSLHKALVQGNKDILKSLGTLSDKGKHLFTPLNTALFDDGIAIRVSRNTKLDKPIELIQLSDPGKEAEIFQPRNLVVLEENASATLIESSISLNELPCFNNTVTEIILNKGSELDYAGLQNVSLNTRYLCSLYIQQHEASRFQCTSTSLGGSWSRIEFNVEFAGEAANCMLNGLYLADENQLVSTHLNVVHSVPNCTSREYFKGILKGNGRAIFDGNVIVEKDAQKTDAQLANHNLLLSRRAEIDSKPVLEICADDVQCGHGTTIGQIDSELLFYLRSRGISEQEARKIICQGFAREILEFYQDQPFRRNLEALLDARLQTIESLDS